VPASEARLRFVTGTVASVEALVEFMADFRRRRE
jgi:hypothetical protein